MFSYIPCGYTKWCNLYGGKFSNIYQNYKYKYSFPRNLSNGILTCPTTVLKQQSYSVLYYLLKINNSNSKYLFSTQYSAKHCSNTSYSCSFNLPNNPMGQVLLTFILYRYSRKPSKSSPRPNSQCEPGFERKEDSSRAYSLNYHDILIHQTTYQQKNS